MRPSRTLLLPLFALVALAVPSSRAAQPPSGTAPPPPTTAGAREPQPLPSLAPLVESVKAAVVNVDVQARGGGRGRGPGGGGEEDPFERFFGGGRERDRVRQGAGSGFIIDPKGLVLTNNHVVERAVTIRVRLDDGRTYDAKVVGRDQPTDVAVLRLEGKVDRLPAVPLGDSDALRVGDWVVAIGNPFGLASSVSAGILSAKARDIGASRFDEFLQTDAAINPGNSGGPLFNLRGEVVGMNTAIIGQATGIGFAVPSNLIKALLPQLQTEGSVTRAWLGIGVQDLGAELARALGVPQSEGAVVTQVNPDSPAAKAGVKVDDVVTAIDGQKVAGAGALIRTVALKRPGSTSKLTLFRAGKPTDVSVKLGTRPAEVDGLEAPGGGGEERSEDVERQQRIGVSLRDLDPRMAEQARYEVREGALITEVAPGSPAERAELAPGMVVVEANRQPVKSAAELLRILRQASAGSTVLLRTTSPGGGRFLRALTVP